MNEVMITALTVGFGTGLSCMAWCVPVLVPYAASVDRPSWWRGLSSSLSFSVGRLISYSGLLLVLALLRSILPTGMLTNAIATLLSGVIAILSGLAVFGVLNWLHGPGRYFCNVISGTKPLFYLGLLTGLRPCAPLIAALTFALTLATPARMSMFLVSFWMASSVLILVLGSASGGLASVFGKSVGMARVRRISGITMVVVGLVLVIQSAGLLLSA